MESVGAILRREREAQDKTVEDVAKSTRISEQIIAALEDDRFSALPAAVYVKGHLRTYARALGLDEDQIVEKYLRFTQQQKDSDEIDEWDEVELVLHEEQKKTTMRWVWVAAAAVVVAVIAIVWSTAGRQPPPSAPVGDVVEEEPTPAAVVTTPAQVAQEDTMIEWNKLELVAIARERTWLRVAVDGRPVSDLTLEAGERRSWEADEQFELDVGNGGGLELYLGGEFLGTAGSDSRLVEGLVIDESGMSE